MSETLLQQVLVKLDGIAHEVSGMKQDMQEFKQELQEVKQEMQEFKHELHGFKQEMQEFKQEQLSMKGEMQEFRKEQQGMKQRLDHIESLVADIPLIRQASLETLDITKRHDSALQSLERKVITDLSTHDYSIDVLHREQLKIKTDIERVKQR